MGFMLKHFLITMYSLQLFFLLENYIKIGSRFIRKGKLREEVLMGCSNQVKRVPCKRFNLYLEKWAFLETIFYF